MKKLRINLAVLMAILVSVVSTTSCSDDLSNEAKILPPFRVYTLEGTARTYFDAEIGSDNWILIQIPPHLDGNAIMELAYPEFGLSRGATITPSPGDPQNFGQVGGVKYTVTAEDKKTTTDYTVTWAYMESTGEPGFMFGTQGASKLFFELGFPGDILQNYDNDNLPDSKLYGDLWAFHAYCGDHIVIISQMYIEESNTEHSVKVVDKNTLEPADVSLNLGAIAISDLKMIVSDYYGTMVGAVVSGNETEFFYWTSPTASPVSVGKIGVNMASQGAANNFQVAGDITGNAWITALAPRGPDGNHYRIKVTGGVLASQYSTVSTGEFSQTAPNTAENPSNGFQMISPYDDSDNPSFVVGYNLASINSEGEVVVNSSAKGLVLTPEGTKPYTLRAFWSNNLPSWPHFVGTGQMLQRPGARMPFVTALPINGKTYVAVASGSRHYSSAAVITDDLQELSHPNMHITTETRSVGWSYGAWIDWYVDDAAKEAHLAIWFGRHGLYTFKMSW